MGYYKAERKWTWIKKHVTFAGEKANKELRNTSDRKLVGEI
jgi:hypothetical protein